MKIGGKIFCWISGGRCFARRSLAFPVVSFKNMNSLEEIELIAVQKLVQNALGKLRILQLSKTNESCLDPTGVYSIGQLIDEKISFLENDFNRILKRKVVEKKSTRRITQTGTDDEEYSLGQVLKNRFEIQALEMRMANLKNSFEDCNQELYEQEQLEIARNRFVNKWASAREEQLLYSIEERSKTLLKDSESRQLASDLGLQAARHINNFYDWQLAKVEADIGDWKDRFECEKELVDSRIQKVRTEKRLWDQMKNELEEIEAEIVELEQSETNFIKAEENKRLCQKYAVQLQAWWRGVMVRKGLGPFKKAKKSKGKKKAKGATTKTKKLTKSKK